MKFGKLTSVEGIDLSLVQDPTDSSNVLGGKPADKFEVYLGSTKWGKADMKGFYPRGTKNELEYYSRQFNGIELNSTFYRIFPEERIMAWKESVPDNFKFCPKVYQSVSHYRLLKNVQEVVDDFLLSIHRFDERLGICFLQMNERFLPKNMERVIDFVEAWPEDISLAIEMRHKDWFEDKAVYDEYFSLLTDKNVTATFIDTPGRRDVLHMHLTTKKILVRFVSVDGQEDYDRLDDWIDRISKWKELGLEEVHFFFHQKLTAENKFLATYMAEQMNKKLDLDIPVPQKLVDV